MHRAQGIRDSGILKDSLRSCSVSPYPYHKYLALLSNALHWGITLCSFASLFAFIFHSLCLCPSKGEGVLPYMGDMDMWGPKGMVF